MKIVNTIASSFVKLIILNIKLDESILLCALRAEKENQEALSESLKRLIPKKEVK
jgi:phosphotransferase system HPr-like phosphotransfer protein